MVWTALGCERRVIMSYAGNASPGPLNKAGLEQEKAHVDQAWADGHFAILNGLSDCLRVDDVIVLHADHLEPLEVKQPGRSPRGAQAARHQQAIDALVHAGPLPGLPPSTVLFDVPLDYATHLEQLDPLMFLTERDGAAAMKVAGGRALVGLNHIHQSFTAAPAAGWAALQTAVDETGQPKRGRHTAGVGVQYAGFAGKKVNCVTSVTLCLITPAASTWVGNELFLQEKEWFTGQDDKGAARRAGVGAAADLQFESKPAIARRKLAELRARGVKFGWAAGDEVYGRSAKLRKDHEDNKEAYAYFVPRDFMVELPGRARVRADEALHLARGTTEVRPCGDGLNGPRPYAWTMIATACPEHFLVIRRPMDDIEPDPDTPNAGDKQDTRDDTTGQNPRTRKLAPGTGFMYCHVPKDSPIAPTLANLLLMIGRRWPVEETIAVGKGPIGWDQNQFRKYTSIQRHNALAAMAMLRANLIRQRLERAQQSPGQATPGLPPRGDDSPAKTAPAVGGPPTTTRLPAEDDKTDDCLIPLQDAAIPHLADQECPPDIGCIRLSLAETLRLVNIARSQASATKKQILLRWSTWRRRHQAIARWHHRRARLAATSPSP